MKDIMLDAQGNAQLSLPDNAVILFIGPADMFVTFPDPQLPPNTTMSIWRDPEHREQVIWYEPKEPLPQSAQKGHIEAWRIWKWYNGLYSMIHSEVLRPFEAAKAECMTYGLPRKDVQISLGHDAPDEECRCGFYAASLPITSPLNHYEGADVVGRVALWGKVIVGETGFRAQYTYPQELWALEGQDWTESLREYGVPVHVIKTWDDLP